MKYGVKMKFKEITKKSDNDSKDLKQCQDILKNNFKWINNNKNKK